MSPLARVSASLVTSVISTVVLVGGGYLWGHSEAEKAATAKAQKAAEAARMALAKETTRADKAAATYLADHIQQQDAYAALDSKYQTLLKRNPLVVYRPGAAAAGCTAAAPQGSGELPAAAALGAAGGDVPHLSLAAVRVWNGALTGTDTPAGACGAAGAAEGADAACAEDSGLTVEDAWANQRINAQSCAEDRQRYRALIDHINDQPR